MKSIYSQKGLSVVQLLIWVLVFGIIIGGVFILINQEKAKTRDAKRISDITRLQAAFEFLFHETNSYVQAGENGCSKLNDPVSRCNLQKYLPNISDFHDPSGGNYTVTAVPEQDNYEIMFHLEKNYGNLKAGKHTLSPAGIR